MALSLFAWPEAAPAAFGRLAQLFLQRIDRPELAARLQQRRRLVQLPPCIAERPLDGDAISFAGGLERLRTSGVEEASTHNTDRLYHPARGIW
jgi:hypothetical protein